MGELWARPYLSMERKIDRIRDRALALSGTPEEALIISIISQAYTDHKAGIKEATQFLESCGLGRAVLEEERRIYGEQIPKRKHYKA